MNDALLIILMIVGFLALYWVLFGQWKYNRIFNQELSDAEKNLEVLRQEVEKYEKEHRKVRKKSKSTKSKKSRKKSSKH